MTMQPSDDYFARFGAENHNIWVVDDRAYVMSRFSEAPETRITCCSSIQQVRKA